MRYALCVMRYGLCVMRYSTTLQPYNLLNLLNLLNYPTASLLSRRGDAVVPPEKNPSIATASPGGLVSKTRGSCSR